MRKNKYEGVKSEGEIRGSRCEVMKNSHGKAKGGKDMKEKETLELMVRRRNKNYIRAALLFLSS